MRTVALFPSGRLQARLGRVGPAPRVEGLQTRPRAAEGSRKGAWARNDWGLLLPRRGERRGSMAVTAVTRHRPGADAPTRGGAGAPAADAPTRGGGACRGRSLCFAWWRGGGRARRPWPGSGHGAVAATPQRARWPPSSSARSQRGKSPPVPIRALVLPATRPRSLVRGLGRPKGLPARPGHSAVPSSSQPGPRARLARPLTMVPML